MYNIRWQKKDYSNLIKAVNRYNKRIKELEQMDLGVDLPDVVNYRDIKKDILSRDDLNQTIKMLDRTRFKNAFDILKLENGKLITRYELNTLEKMAKRGINRLQEELQQENEKATFKGLRNDNIIRLEASISTLQNWKTKTDPQAFKYAKERIRTLGNLSYERRRAINFRNVYMKVFNANLRKYKNYGTFKNELDKIKDPKEFYEFIKKSDFLMDVMKIYYHPETGFSRNENFIYGSFDNNEQAFNNTLISDYGLDIEE